jgi:hypothetical protein
VEAAFGEGSVSQMSNLTFRRLNPDWSAEPNAPSLNLQVHGDEVVLSFYLNPFAYEAGEEEVGILHFHGCSRWRWDPTNDHAWYAGKGRFSGQAPEWGEFYEIIGDDASMNDLDWEVLGADTSTSRHFLFYFRDEAIECVASGWSLERGTQKVS